MRKNKNALYKRFYKIIKNPYIIISSITVIFLCFFLVRIATKNIQIPSVYSTVLFSISILFLVATYTVLKNKESKRILLWIFLISLTFEILIFLAMPLNTSKWADARGYHNLAIYTSEKGPLYLIENYHRLVGWNSSFCPDAEQRLDNMITNENLLAFVKDKMHVHDTIDLSGHNFTDYSADRPGLHPPGWILMLYPFVSLFGQSEIAAILAEFILASILSAAVYWFLRNHVDFKTSLFLTFLFILSPAFIIYSDSPVMDIPLAIFIVLSVQLYLESMRTHKTKHLLLASILFSIALFIKFISIFFYLLFFLITIIRKGSMKNFAYFAMLSVVPILLLSLLNYYYFLNIISSFVFASCAPDMVGVPSWLYFIIRFPKEILILFSIPLLYMITIGTLKILFRKKKGEKEKIMLTYVLCFFITGFSIAMGMSRLLFMFSPLLILLAINQVKKNFKPKFVYFSIIVSSIQLFVLLVLNILNL